MSFTLRVVLIIASIASFILCIKKVQKSKLQITNSIIWMIGSIFLIIISVFPNIAVWVSNKLGFMAPVNFVFFAIITFLLIEVYYADLRISTLNEKLKKLNHHIALEENEKDKR